MLPYYLNENYKKILTTGKGFFFIKSKTSDHITQLIIIFAICNVTGIIPTRTMDDGREGGRRTNFDFMISDTVKQS